MRIETALDARKAQQLLALSNRWRSVSHNLKIRDKFELEPKNALLKLKTIKIGAVLIVIKDFC